MKILILSIIEALKEFLASLGEEPKEVSEDVNPPAKHFRNERVLVQAASQVGVLEWKDGSNPQVEKYLDYGNSAGNKNSGLTDDVPWCAGFIAWVLETVGMGSTNKLNARSYLKWGVSTMKDPLPGDLVVFWRGSKDSWKGHVTIFLGWYDAEKTKMFCVGGNQNDAVNVSRYPVGKILDIRRSSLHRKLSEAEQDYLWDLGERIIADKKVSLGGKVV